MLNVFRMLAASLLGVGLFAQQQPRLIWEGEVDGSAIIYVRGKRIQVEDRGGGFPIQRQRHKFFDPLPDNRQNVEVRVIDGRGQVRVLEQPRLENNYTLAVSVDDRQAGAAFYSLEFYWEGSPFSEDPFARKPRGGSSNWRGDRMTWSGRVDGEAVISCRGNTCESQARSGQPVVRERFQFSRPMPDRNFRVSLGDVDGRGEVRLIEQPSERNGHIAQVLIRDTDGGASNYSFSLLWERTGREEREPLFTQRGVVWAGRVDGQVRVIIQGRTARTDVVTGAPVSGERAQFERELPQRQTSNVQVRKRRGRGRVEILEFPSSRNGYRIVFEITDSSGGADQYEVEVGW